MLPKPAAAIAIAGSIAAALSVLLPWLRVGAAGSVHFYTGTGLPILAVLFVTLSALTIACAVAAAIGGRPESREVAALTAGAAASISGVFLFLVECASTLLPNGLLPATLRRYTLDLRAGPGLWLTLAASTVAAAVLASSNELRTGVSGFEFRRPAIRTLNAVCLIALAGLAVAVGVLRYASWIDAAAAGQHYGIGGWGIPWVGPLSLTAMLGLVTAVAALVTGRVQAAALLSALSGWLLTTAAGLTLIVAGTLSDVAFASFAPRAVRQYAPTLGPAGAAMIVFLLGLLAVGVGAALLIGGSGSTGSASHD